MAIGRVPGQTGIQPSIVTAKGDLIVATASGSVTNQSVGSNNQVLTADSAQADGVKWANGSAATLTTTGDIIYASAANTPARLGIGSTDQVLKVSGGLPVWGAAPAAGFSGARASKNTTQSIADASSTKVTFQVEDYDVGGYFTTGANTKMTVPSGKGGYYLVIVNIAYATSSAGTRVAAIGVNGGALSTQFETAPNPASGRATTVCGSDILYLNAGDYIEISAYQTSGGNLNLVNDANDIGWVAVQYLGA